MTAGFLERGTVGGHLLEAARYRACASRTAATVDHAERPHRWRVDELNSATRAVTVFKFLTAP